jgi:hypothetical protein
VTGTDLGMSMTTNRARAGAALSVLTAAGAGSAGIHAGLAPEHVHEWAPLGAAFIAAAAAASAGVVALALRPASPWPPRLLGALLGSLVLAYALTRLAALPPLDPDKESVDALGVCTSALEVAGVVIAIRLGRRGSGRGRSPAVTTGGRA